MKTQQKELLEHLTFLYGKEKAPTITDQVVELLKRFNQEYPELAKPAPNDKVSERDIILITYGDMIQKYGENPLKTLSYFFEKYLLKIVSTIHILPFFPYSSDDGFSVIDYRQVDSKLGDWDDISHLNKNFRLMFDAVVNHVSSQSDMFQAFLKGDPQFQDYFTVVAPEVDLSKVFRPRATPVLTPFKTQDGEKLVWTTFSADQIDLNYRNPDVLLEVINILLFYAANGAEFIRFDAVTFVWKEVGTPSINMPHTHRFVQLMRTIIDIVSPNISIITETNVPHKDNIAYFGNGLNEAQMVYNFALPLLTLHALIKGDVTTLTEWAEKLELPSDQVTFFNFLAGHDGIGMLPVKDILSSEDLVEIMDRVKVNGGNISYRSNEDGVQSPYELNISYIDALRDPNKSEDDVEILIKRFLAAYAIMLSLRGVPGIYFHSMFGSRNWLDGVTKTDRYRSINREKLQLVNLEEELSDPTSLRHIIFNGFREMLKKRNTNPAFHPNGGQKILNLHNSIFSFLRISPDEQTKTLCLHNISNQSHTLSVDISKLPFGDVDSLLNIINNQQLFITNNKLEVRFEPYEILWLRG